MTIITFDDVIEKCLRNKFERNLLLGNGFSIAYDSNIFSYDKLFEYSNMQQNVKSVFHEFKTYDFEIIIRKFVEAARLFKHYRPDDSIAEELETEANKIKEELVNSISEKHPNSQKDIGQNNIFNTLLFLSNFKNIFTLNYDLLLYWTLMNKSDLIIKYPKLNNIFEINDGFHGREYLTWGYKKEEQNIFYLHGALHLVDNFTSVNKIKNNEFDSLTSIIQENLEQDKYPLIVAEGSSKEKLAKIKHNEYLNYCYQNLGCIQGNLIIHGHSLEKNDRHIFDLINTNTNIKNIYISIFDPESNYQTISDKAINIFRKRLDQNSLQIFFYDALSTKIWSDLPI